MNCLNTILKELSDYEKRRRRRSKRNKKKAKLDKEDTLEKLCNIKDELETLNSMIGMEEVKETVAEHVLYLAQGLSSENDMNHIQICGEPGTGKTTLAEVLGKVYAGLGFLENGEVMKVTRSDLIGDHLGSTTIKTEEVLYSCLGSVLFIDEVYSFGCQDKKDSFSKEAIDCINQFLSEHRGEILCIISGYEQDIRECFFSMNRGLERRFPWKYNLKPYTISQLREVFMLQLKKEEWNLNEDVETSLNSIFCQSNASLFNNYGGDTEMMMTRCKIAHSTRMFENNDTDDFKKISGKDVLRGYETFKKHKNCFNRLDEKLSHSMIYC
jgi:SpoVK/Ycf46/Vps4 family AAA+-type ATPase